MAKGRISALIPARKVAKISRRAQDIYVTVRSEVANSPEKLQQVIDEVHEIAELFGQVKKFPVNPVVEIDSLAAAHKTQLHNTPFIRLGD